MKNSSGTMVFGIEPTCWTNDDFTEIGDEFPYQLILDQTSQSGFAGGSTGHNYPTHLPSLKHAFTSRGLKIASTWAGTTFTTGVAIDDSLQTFQKQVAFLKAVDAHDVVVAELANATNQIRTKSVLTDRPIFNAPEWYLLTNLLNSAGKYAHEQGLQLGYHPHVGTGVMTIDETARLMDSTDPEYVGLCLDTGHLRYGGASQSELEDFTKKYAKRISHVHLKNVRKSVLPVAVADHFSFYQAIEHGIFTVPGDPAGDLDFLPILQILLRVGYDRWIVVEAEQNPKNADPLQCAKMARSFLREHFGY